MGLDLEYIDGQTPIDEEEKEGLRIETISTKGELDEFEQLNIEEALQWVFGKNLNLNKYSRKSLFVICINVCMVTYGIGQVSLEKPIKHRSRQTSNSYAAQNAL